MNLTVPSVSGVELSHRFGRAPCTYLAVHHQSKLQFFGKQRFFFSKIKSLLHLSSLPHPLWPISLPGACTNVSESSCGTGNAHPDPRSDVEDFLFFTPACPSLQPTFNNVIAFKTATNRKKKKNSEAFLDADGVLATTQ